MLNVFEVCHVVPPSIEYWYGAVAPDAFTLKLPSFPPKQLTFVTFPWLTTSTVGCVIVSLAL